MSDTFSSLQFSGLSCQNYMKSTMLRVLGVTERDYIKWKIRGCFFLGLCHFRSVQFNCLVMSDSLRPHEPQHARPPCPSPTPSLKLMSMESVMPSSHLILCHLRKPFLLSDWPNDFLTKERHWGSLFRRPYRFFPFYYVGSLLPVRGQSP